MLNVNNIEVRYGSVVAVADVDLTIGDGEVVAIIGPNGAGKSSLLRAISGLIPVSRGSITMDGVSLSGLEPYKIARLGIGHVPEGRGLFSALSVEENIRIGMQHLGIQSKDERFEMVYDLFPRLKERRNQKAGTMSGGEQQMLAIARALVGEPKVLILDEPSMGLAPLVVKEVYENLASLKLRNQTTLLVEQNAQLALSMADRCYVLASGRRVMEGNSEDLRKNAELISAYLGDIH